MNGIVLSVASHATHRFSKEVRDRIRIVAGEGVADDAHCGRTVKHRSRVARDPTQPNLRQVHLIHVELFDEHQVMAMRQRLQQLRNGQGAAPLPAPRTKACEKCGHRTVCQRTFGDRE